MPTFKLRKRGQITKRKSDVTDIAYKGDQFSTQFDVWADIRPLSGNERIVADQIVHGATHEIIVRWPGEDVTTEMQLEVEGQAYPILHVDDYDGAAQYLRLLCSTTRRAVGRDTTR